MNPISPTEHSTTENAQLPADAATLTAMTVKELRELATSRFPQIRGVSGLNKGPLIAAIQDAMAQSPQQAAAPEKTPPPSATAPATRKSKATQTTQATQAEKTPIRLPAFPAEECPATTPAGKAKAQRNFLRDYMRTVDDNATRAAVRRQMKRLKKGTRRKPAAE
ncbi:Rho termination factor N-terminal domain-containing protein [Desulfovibrio psychrotolerans]|uniref:Rho termination factor-like N-terminal domain-containing protein n=1 Tax=Desulfovibrio psychrotolerans TaxID=415242 RepID=A0A7J0BT51_9BACT|nr:Rho termination factor N-terminal domain-containing protein [Desulfovibrio psychrotolerans]GFM36889.1 hypothetical protein DSM19430T_15730 [Desulfovibrio psychrotolerans]